MFKLIATILFAQVLVAAPMPTPNEKVANAVEGSAFGLGAGTAAAGTIEQTVAVATGEVAEAAMVGVPGGIVGGAALAAVGTVLANGHAAKITGEKFGTDIVQYEFSRDGS